MHLKLIGCEVICREFCHALARSPHTVDVEFLPKALHDAGARAMRARLQEMIDAHSRSAQDHEALLLGFALCGSGTAGLRARKIPLVIPRSHDCIGLLMGGLPVYNRHFEANPGTYYRSSGWIERGSDLQPYTQCAHSLPQLIEKYGADNGRYLYDQLTSYQQSYTHLTYIRTGLEADENFERQARAEAERRGWKFTHLEGNLGIFERLLSGQWDDSEFLVVPPGQHVVAKYDGTIFTAAL